MNGASTAGRCSTARPQPIAERRSMLARPRSTVVRHFTAAGRMAAERHISRWVARMAAVGWGVAHMVAAPRISRWGLRTAVARHTAAAPHGGGGGGGAPRLRCRLRPRASWAPARPRTLHLAYASATAAKRWSKLTKASPPSALADAMHRRDPAGPHRCQCFGNQGGVLQCDAR